MLSVLEIVAAQLLIALESADAHSALRKCKSVPLVPNGVSIGRAGRQFGQKFSFERAAPQSCSDQGAVAKEHECISDAASRVWHRLELIKRQRRLVILRFE
jgi:hypothetical protein